MKLLDLVSKEFIAIVEHLSDKVPIKDGKIILNSNTFYSLLDTNLYITRKEKLEIYRSLNFIVCNSNGLTSVVYDKETKKTVRKIIINYSTYEVLKKITEIEFS